MSPLAHPSTGPKACTPRFQALDHPCARAAEALDRLAAAVARGAGEREVAEEGLRGAAYLLQARSGAVRLDGIDGAAGEIVTLGVSEAPRDARTSRESAIPRTAGASPCGASAAARALSRAVDGEPDVASSSGAAVVRRLAVGARELGHVALAERRDGRPFDEADGRRLGSFARSLSLAVVASRAETWRRGAEERRMRSERLEAVGRTTASILHDLNNLLTVVLGQAELQLARATDERARRGGAAITVAANRATQLARNLLAFVRQLGTDPERVDVAACLEAMEPVLEALVEGDTEFRLEVSPTVGPVWMPRGHLEQVLLNLCSNARDALAGAGRLIVRATPRREGGREHVELSVEDDGPGIPASLLASVKEPFVSTRAGSGGTGLGLSTVDAIVRDAGGRVLIESEEGRGTTVRVVLPRAPESEGEAQRA